MIWIVVCLLLILVITVLGYPKLDDLQLGDTSDDRKRESVSIVEFFRKYKLFVLTMTGVLLVGVCHAMSESYFIAIFQSMGGGRALDVFGLDKMLMLALTIAFAGTVVINVSLMRRSKI